MRSSKVVFKTNAQNKMAKYGIARKFHDLKYSQLGYSFIFLEFIINTRARSRK